MEGWREGRQRSALKMEIKINLKSFRPGQLMGGVGLVKEGGNLPAFASGSLHSSEYQAADSGRKMSVSLHSH